MDWDEYRTAVLDVAADVLSSMMTGATFGAADCDGESVQAILQAAPRIAHALAVSLVNEHHAWETERDAHENHVDCQAENRAGEQ